MKPAAAEVDGWCREFIGEVWCMMVVEVGVIDVWDIWKRLRGQNSAQFGIGNPTIVTTLSHYHSKRIRL